MPERWAKKKMGKKWCALSFLKKMDNAKKKKGGQKMGHQIGKDRISLKSKMNVLKSMVVNVMTSRLRVYPRMWLLVMLTQKSPTVSVVKRSNR